MQEARITGSSKQLGLVRTCFCPAEVRPRGNYLHAVGHPSDSDSDLSTPSTHLSIFLNRLLSFFLSRLSFLSLAPSNFHGILFVLGSSSLENINDLALFVYSVLRQW